MSVTTIVLADDHRVVRNGLRALLDAEADLSVVGEAADGLETLALVERVKPTVLVADLAMPGLGGLDVTREARRRSPETRTVILSMYADEAYVLEAMNNGAYGYVMKDASAADLLRAVREAAAGRRYLSPPLKLSAVEDYARRHRGAPVDLYETLTSRERAVLHLAGEGLTNAEIGARLSISGRTAESHRANLMRKLGLRGQTDLVRYTIERRILPPKSAP
jgi:two-component system, NarL family, response regulator NreC